MSFARTRLAKVLFNFDLALYFAPVNGDIALAAAVIAIGVIITMVIVGIAVIVAAGRARKRE
jgi:hypothetical protein